MLHDLAVLAADFTSSVSRGYTGARVQEVLWVRKQDVVFEDGIWLLDLQETKNGRARRVPVHDALIDEGLLRFVESAEPGYLFVGDRPAKKGATRSAQEMRAAELAAWISSKVTLVGVSPNHGWRHTWITIAEKVGIPKRFSNAITGHNARKDVSNGYVSNDPLLLAEQMRKFPRYDLSIDSR